MRVAGADGRSFLHALVTNDVASLEPGASRYAALLTPQGRMITDMTLVMSAPDVIHLAVPSDVAAPLAARLDRLIFTEAVEVADVSPSTAHFSVTGPAAAGAVAAATEAVDTSGQGPAILWRSDELDLGGVDVIVPAGAAGTLRTALERLCAPLSREARQILRVEAGRPEFHVDMTEETIPLEANLLDRAISTTKGCYVGQEVIIRVLHRGGGRVAKRLVRLRFDGAGVPAAGSALSTDGRGAGTVTSAVWSPRAGAAIGLGYVHRDLVREGLPLSLPDGRRATITSV